MAYARRGNEPDVREGRLVIRPDLQLAKIPGKFVQLTEAGAAVEIQLSQARPQSVGEVDHDHVLRVGVDFERRQSRVVNIREDYDNVAVLSHLAEVEVDDRAMEIAHRHARVGQLGEWARQLEPLE